MPSWRPRACIGALNRSFRPLDPTSAEKSVKGLGFLRMLFTGLQAAHGANVVAVISSVAFVVLAVVQPLWP